MLITIPIMEDLEDSIDRYLTEYNWTKRGTADGTPEYQKFGILAECVVHKYFLGKYPNLRKKDKDDGGIDFTYNGFTYDVKCVGTNGWPRPEHAFISFAIQKSKADIIIICHYHKKQKVITIMGWVPRQALCDPRRLFKKGTLINGRVEMKFDGYVVRFGELNRIYHLFEEVT